MAPPVPLLLLLATSSSCFHQPPSIYPAPLTLRAFNAFLQPPLNPFSLLHPPKKISTSRPLKKIPPPKISSRISASLASRPIALLRVGLNSASRLANYFIQVHCALNLPYIDYCEFIAVSERGTQSDVC